MNGDGKRMFEDEAFAKLYHKAVVVGNSSKTSFARDLGVDRSTVRNYLAREEVAQFLREFQTGAAKENEALIPAIVEVQEKIRKVNDNIEELTALMDLVMGWYRTQLKKKKGHLSEEMEKRFRDNITVLDKLYNSIARNLERIANAEKTLSIMIDARTQTLNIVLTEHPDWLRYKRAEAYALKKMGKKAPGKFAKGLEEWLEKHPAEGAQ